MDLPLPLGRPIVVSSEQGNWQRDTSCLINDGAEIALLFRLRAYPSVLPKLMAITRLAQNLPHLQDPGNR